MRVKKECSIQYDVLCSNTYDVRFDGLLILQYKSKKYHQTLSLA